MQLTHVCWSRDSMRLFLGSTLALAAIASPAGVEAQLTWEMREPAPPRTAPKAEEPPVDPTPAAEPKSSAVIEAEKRAKRARISLGVSAVPLAIGAIIAGAGALGSINQIGSSPPADTSGQDAALIAGSAMVGAAAVWMIASGITLGVRNRQLRQAQGTTKREQKAAKRAPRRTASPSPEKAPKKAPSRQTRPYDKRLAR